MTDNEQITACDVVFDCFSDLRLCAKNIGIRHEKRKMSVSTQSRISHALFRHYLFRFY